MMDGCDDGASFDLGRGGDPTICDKQLNLEGMMPGAIGQRRILHVVTYMWNLKKKKVDYTEMESTSSPACLMMYSAYKLHKQGDSIQS